MTQHSIILAGENLPLDLILHSLGFFFNGGVCDNCHILWPSLGSYIHPRLVGVRFFCPICAGSLMIIDKGWKASAEDNHFIMVFKDSGIIL